MKKCLLGTTYIVMSSAVSNLETHNGVLSVAKGLKTADICNNINDGICSYPLTKRTLQNYKKKLLKKCFLDTTYKMT